MGGDVAAVGARRYAQLGAVGVGRQAMGRAHLVDLGDQRRLALGDIGVGAPAGWRIAGAGAWVLGVGVGLAGTVVAAGRGVADGWVGVATICVGASAM